MPRTQPVVFTDECGNLTGIPIPVTAEWDRFLNLTIILPMDGTETRALVPWSATNVRYLIGVYFYVSRTSNTLDHPILRLDGRISLEIENPTTLAYDVLSLDNDNRVRRSQFNMFKQIDPAMRFAIGETLNLIITNSTESAIPIGFARIDLVFIEV